MDRSKIFFRHLVMGFLKRNTFKKAKEKHPWQKSSFECLLGSKKSDIFRAS